MFWPIKTMQIAKDLYAINSIMVNFYAVDTGDGLIVFDTGINPMIAIARMSKLGLDPALVSHVFLTHSDYDHMGGLKAFGNAKVYLSKKEEPMVTGRKARLLIKYNTRLDEYQTLEDRQVVTVGHCKVELISTPGHTVGSACYLIDDTILVAGDTLRLSKSGRILPFLFLQNMSHSGDKRSLEQLRSEGIIERSSMILSGHTGILEQSKLK